MEISLDDAQYAVERGYRAIKAAAKAKEGMAVVNLKDLTLLTSMAALWLDE